MDDLEFRLHEISATEAGNKSGNIRRLREKGYIDAEHKPAKRDGSEAGMFGTLAALAVWAAVLMAVFG